MALRLPHTFQGGGYQVTVNADRSVLVKPGDWLSKYTMAIWGDFKDEHIRAFKRRIGAAYSDISNPNLIKAGEILYVRTPLPGEGGIGIFPGEDKPGGSLPGTGQPETDPEVPRGRVNEFLNWVRERFWVSDWELAGTAGINLSAFFGTGQYMVVDVKHTATQVTGRFHNVALGATLNLPKSAFGLSGSPPIFPTYGTIKRSPWYPRLTLEDFCHGTLVVEFSFAFGLGSSPSMFFFGMGMPPWRILDALQRFIQTGDPAIFGLLIRDAGPKGVAFFAGLEASTPGVGMAMRVGAMYDRAPWRAR
jgi:hypothetical protein